MNTFPKACLHSATEERTTETRGELGTNSSGRGCSCLAPGPLGLAEHPPMNGSSRETTSLCPEPQPPTRRAAGEQGTRRPSPGSSGCPCCSSGPARPGPGRPHPGRTQRLRSPSVSQGARLGLQSQSRPQGGTPRPRVTYSPRPRALQTQQKTPRARIPFRVWSVEKLRELVSSVLEIKTPRISEREGHVTQLCLYSTQSCHSAIS